MKIFTKISGLWWYHARWMVSLGHVSRRWRAVLLATPEYWAQGLEDCLDAENDQGRNHLLSLFVERSSPCSLQLDMWNASSDADYYGWKAFKGHWWRLDDLEVSVGSENELFKILRRISKLKRLERLQLEVDCEVSTQDLDQWKAKSHPHLGCLEISSPVFCRATTVPSLHTLILLEPRDPDSLPGLLDALQRCPALATLRVEFEWMDTRTQPVSTQLDRRMLDLPNLRHLRVAGRVADIHSFLSCISFPASAAQIELVVRDAHDALRSVLPDILPTRLSILHMSPTIDRLFLQSDVEYSTAVPFVSMRGYVRGAERLQVSPVLWLDGAARFLQFLDVFGACTVAELALDLRRVISDMDGEFWRRFFAALPDLRRLERCHATWSRGRQSEPSRDTFSRPAGGRIRWHMRYLLPGRCVRTKVAKAIRRSWRMSLATSNRSWGAMRERVHA
ncbi:hypothetical protein LXA43DRAFT_423209 [Ganoderma leucocontextum]|nr:hypothetical protein LXA43DRAFT_423209 [Ganoderma leucocontextum]